MRHPQSCDGQSGYSTTKLDGIVEVLVLEMFRSVRAASKSELSLAHVEQQRRIKESALAKAQKALSSAQKELALYESEIAKVLRGESVWDTAVLNDMILRTREQVAELDAECISRQTDYESCESLAAEAEQRYENVQSWADLYNMSSREAKKMIMYQLIKQVRVSRDYRLEIDLNIGYDQFACFLPGLQSQDGSVN